MSVTVPTALGPLLTRWPNTAAPRHECQIDDEQASPEDGLGANAYRVAWCSRLQGGPVLGLDAWLPLIRPEGESRFEGSWTIDVCNSCISLAHAL